MDTHSRTRIESSAHFSLCSVTRIKKKCAVHPIGFDLLSYCIPPVFVEIGIKGNALDTPASSKVSLRAASSTVSSSSHPPFGKDRLSGFRLQLITSTSTLLLFLLFVSIVVAALSFLTVSSFSALVSPRVNRNGMVPAISLRLFSSSYLC